MVAGLGRTDTGNCKVRGDMTMDDHQGSKMRYLLAQGTRQDSLFHMEGLPPFPERPSYFAWIRGMGGEDDRESPRPGDQSDPGSVVTRGGWQGHV